MEREIIYGINPVIEALKADRLTINKILVAEGKEASFLKMAQQLARERGVPIHRCRREFLDREAGSETHQGVLGYLSGASYASWEDVERRIAQTLGHSLVLVLDSIEDPQNLGSLIRTAESCGVQGVLIPKDRAVGLTPTVVKASAGAVAHIPIVRVTNLAQAIDDLKKQGFWVVGTDAHGGKSLYEMKFDMNVALVIGSEGKGIRPLLLKKCDFTVSIPMRGKITSLNTAIAGAVILYEILRQQTPTPSPRGAGKGEGQERTSSII
jgi:23S rRNA (guanosine2251-2'-O)-methyltransferase